MSKDPKEKPKDAAPVIGKPHKNYRVPKPLGSELIDALYPSARQGFIDVSTTICERVGRLANELGKDSRHAFNACQKLNLLLKKQPLPDQIACLETHIANHRETLQKTPIVYRESELLTICLLEDLLLDRERLLGIEVRKKKNNELLGLSIGTGESIDLPEPDAAKKFTRKQAMALLQELIPEFKDADNTKKAEFLVLLTPHNGKRNIAQEFSYLRTADYTDLVEDWRDKLQRTGRGRKKKTT